MVNHWLSDSLYYPIWEWLGLFHYTRMPLSAVRAWIFMVIFHCRSHHCRSQRAILILSQWAFRQWPAASASLHMYVMNELGPIRIISVRSRHQALLCNRLIQHLFRPNEWDARLCHHARSTTERACASLCVWRSGWTLQRSWSPSLFDAHARASDTKEGVTFGHRVNHEAFQPSFGLGFVLVTYLTTNRNRRVVEGPLISDVNHVVLSSFRKYIFPWYACDIYTVEPPY
jgi:hypothetical protein